MQRIDALKAIARNLRDLIVDTTPASYCATYIDATKLIHPLTNQLQGVYAYIYSGAGAGQNRIVGSSDPANKRIFFPQPLDSVPSANSQFILLQHFDKDEYDNALDRIIGKAKVMYLETKVATSTLVATQYEYLVPSGFEYINTLRIVPSNSSDYDLSDDASRQFEFRSNLWRIEANVGGSFHIVFDSRKVSMTDFDNEMIKIMGQAKADINATDNAVLPDDLEEYVVNGATMIMASQRISENREWSAKFQIFRDLTSGLESYVHRTRFGKKVGY